MPTCWDGRLGNDGDPFTHMAYTLDGLVAGECPDTHTRRLPQIQLFVRITPYNGGTYVLSDENDRFHVDFFNGWQENKLQEIIDDCPVEGDANDGYNPPCTCDDFLTANEDLAETAVCDNDVRTYIVNEATDVVTGSLPRGTCSADLIAKSWDIDPPFNCDASPIAPTPIAPTPTAPTPTAPTPTVPTPTVPTPTVPTPTAPTPTNVTPSPAVDDDEDDEFVECADSSLRFKLKWNGRNIARDCSWVGNKQTEARCEEDGVSAMCAKTCDACDECEDSDNRMKLEWNGRKITRDCSWVANKQTIARCEEIEGVADACRDTCGVC
jgi:hypothetical protein